MSKTELEIMRAPVISTRHSPGPFAFDDVDSVYVMRGEYGCLVSLPFLEEGEGVNDRGLPEWLKDVRVWANAQGFDYVRFDADAHEVPDLPTFDEAW